MKAIYTGSFDPITLGHMDIIQRAALLFQDLTIGLAINPSKSYLFTTLERKNLIQTALNQLGLKTVSIVEIKGLVADFANMHGFKYVIKGARNAQDFDYERPIHDVSLTQNHTLETITLIAPPHLSHVSSSVSKELAKHQGLVHKYVPLHVKHALELKNNQLIVGVTGTIASGKSTLCKELVSTNPSFTNLPNFTHHINLDDLAHELREGQLPISEQLRANLIAVFGTSDRVKLGELVYGNQDLLNKLNSIYQPPLLTYLRQKVSGLKGLILLEGAVLAEFNWLFLCNNNVILMQTPDEATHRARLMKRGLTEIQATRRINSQFDFTQKEKLIQTEQLTHHYGATLSTTYVDTTLLSFLAQLAIIQ